MTNKLKTKQDESKHSFLKEYKHEPNKSKNIP